MKKNNEKSQVVGEWTYGSASHRYPQSYYDQRRLSIFHAIGVSTSEESSGATHKAAKTEEFKESNLWLAWT